MGNPLLRTVLIYENFAAGVSVSWFCEGRSERTGPFLVVPESSQDAWVGSPFCTAPTRFVLMASNS